VRQDIGRKEKPVTTTHNDDHYCRHNMYRPPIIEHHLVEKLKEDSLYVWDISLFKTYMLNKMEKKFISAKHQQKIIVACIYKLQ